MYTYVPATHRLIAYELNDLCHDSWDGLNDMMFRLGKITFEQWDERSNNIFNSRIDKMNKIYESTKPKMIDNTDSLTTS